MTQRVGVFGATGQIGRPLCSALMRAGHSVVVFSRDPDGARPVVPGAADYVRWTPGDLSRECADHLKSADAVVYLAGAPLFDGRRHSRAARDCSATRCLSRCMRHPTGCWPANTALPASTT